MRIGLSPEEQVQDAATKQADRQRKRSAQANPGEVRKKLIEVFQGANVSLPAGASSLGIRQVACDSRKVQAAALFFPFHGTKADGNAFIQHATKRQPIPI